MDYREHRRKKAKLKENEVCHCVHLRGSMEGDYGMSDFFLVQVAVLGMLLVVGAVVSMVAARSARQDREAEENATEFHPSRGCKNFCVNGHLAGNCHSSMRRSAFLQDCAFVSSGTFSPSRPVKSLRSLCRFCLVVSGRQESSPPEAAFISGGSASARRAMAFCAESISLS